MSTVEHRAARSACEPTTQRRSALPQLQFGLSAVGVDDKHVVVVVVLREHSLQLLNWRRGPRDVEDEAEQALVAVVDAHTLKRVLGVAPLRGGPRRADGVIVRQLLHIEAPISDGCLLVDAERARDLVEHVTELLAQLLLGDPEQAHLGADREEVLDLLPLGARDEGVLPLGAARELLEVTAEQLIEVLRCQGPLPVAQPKGQAKLLDGAARKPVGDLLGGEVFARRARGQRRSHPGARAEQ